MLSKELHSLDERKPTSRAKLERLELRTILC